MKQKQRPVPPPPIHPVVPAIEEKPFPKPSEKKEFPKTSNKCAWRNSLPVKTTLEVRYFIYIEYLARLLYFIKIRQLYDTLPFDDPNGGVWKQGYDLEYNTSQWTSNRKLKIVLMPHSHCDPGI
jgi:hypothetical protein